MATSKLQALWNHPAGPKTIHFWAPTFKWGISIANIVDFSKPPEKLSYPQQIEELEPFYCPNDLQRQGSTNFHGKYGTIISPRQKQLLQKNDDEKS